MGVSVSIDHRLGDFRVRAEFACEGRLTALFGPSGSGKTSIVNAIAGLLRPDRAKIVINGVTLADTSAGLSLPAHRRNIGYVFQEARLFPHMNVRQNLLYAQWFGGRRPGSGGGVQAVVDMLGIERLLKRYPSHLSGGEKQRVAIGRALLSHPRLLLMDEPLASLDDARKQEILPYIERLRDEANIPIIYVSHSLAEVTRLADFIVVMDHGEVRGLGPPQAALSHIGSPDAAQDFNVLNVLAVETRLDGDVMLKTPAGFFRAPEGASSASQIGFSSRSVVIALSDPGRTSAQNALAAKVQSIDLDAVGVCRVRLCAGEAEITAFAPPSFVRANTLREGANVYLLVTDFTLL
jgi:molybdate transport system ATP-binding protein